ncbi:MAG: pentapeptide repeat-containing protein [Leptolyngbya sp. UWPOB_LEPTO1]|uniref:pentapeptide repeat-containing protein n=1 Tax=Leptolyngbya sp. UWPOB_LEPTO1 TaxID=2815653 RepID=UPI001AC2F343|nr:pentapeptide repeat-containing protein [Leptolyngbya sp. UWPOB_LEPTO1]MBN8561080.1 pentapeptide repeat-containing protein [Leptolyngbya sp. UWPOB_LEPTO1]
MDLLIDADVILEVLLNRRNSSVEEAEILWDMLHRQQIKGFITSLGIKKIRATVELFNAEEVDENIADLENILEVCYEDDAILAMSRELSFVEFESALEIACALHKGIPAIVTLSSFNFKGAELPILSIESVVKRHNLEHQFVSSSSTVILYGESLSDVLDLASLERTFARSEAYENIRSNSEFASNLSYCDLAGFDFRERDLRFCNLSFSNLSNSNLQGAHLRRANLLGANLSQANLGTAILTNADLTDTDLSQAVLIEAISEYAKFNGADLSYANLNRAILTSVFLTGAWLISAELNDACLCHAFIQDADLSYASLLRTKLQGASLRYSKLNNADLRNARMNYANLSHADLSGADLTGADLTGANLSYCKLTGACLKWANLDSANLMNAVLDGAITEDTILHPSGYSYMLSL